MLSPPENGNVWPPSLEVRKLLWLTTTIFVPLLETATSSSPPAPLLNDVGGKMGGPAPAAPAPEELALAAFGEAAPPWEESERFGELSSFFRSCWSCPGSPADPNVRLWPMASTTSLSCWLASDGRLPSSRTSRLPAATAVVI